MKGLDTISSPGFDQSQRLKFHHPNPVDEYDGYANILTVPVFMSDYDLFRKYILQLLVSVMFFLQMHKLLHQRMSCSLLTNTFVI